MKKTQVKKVLVFGTFDRLHKGHAFFLKEAKKLGRLYVSVASKKSVFTRKGKRPLEHTAQRIKALKKLDLAHKVSEGDKIMGNWKDIKIIKPHIVAVGYDQDHLQKALKKIQKLHGFKIKKIKKHDAIS